MIKYHQEYSNSGTGLAYQISCYVMMRSLAERKGLDWAIDPTGFKALRNTFVDLKLNVVDTDDSTYKTFEFPDDIGFAELETKVEDQILLSGYPTVQNFVASGDDGDLFLSIKKELKFRQDIIDKCKSFRDQFDGEVIALHVRGGDFHKVESGMFMCGNDYYENALAQLPSDIPVLVFTNDKDYVISNSELIANNPERFTFITDLFNNNELINCDVGQELDRLVDIDGQYRFDYKFALAHMARVGKPSAITYAELTQRMAELTNQLSPEYREKIKTQSYNYSYDLCLMTMCDYVIMANSTFSMWGAELGNPQKVIYPMYWIQDHSEDYTNNITIKTDLEGFNQTEYFASQLVGRSHYYPVENPDPRSFTVVR